MITLELTKEQIELIEMALDELQFSGSKPPKDTCDEIDEIRNIIEEAKDE